MRNLGEVLMKEIGGYFELEQLINDEYYKELIRLNNGRNALLYILKAKNIRKLYIPYYICDVITNMLNLYGYDFEYYSIDSEFMPMLNKTLLVDEYLYIVNYYGQITNEKVSYLKKKYKRIILDNTQAFFQKPISDIDTIYTCRKFFGVSDGAYLFTDVKIRGELIVDISQKRMSHILGRYEGNASEYYESFKKNNEDFKNEPLKYMSKLTHNILGAIDYERVRKIRNENYAYLNNKFSINNKIELVVPDGPFAYPFYVENGTKIRKLLAQKKIYIPTLWPNVLVDTQESSIEYDYTANILPLPCDQRYEIDDMKYIIECLQNLINYVAL